MSLFSRDHISKPGQVVLDCWQSLQIMLDVSDFTILVLPCTNVFLLSCLLLSTTNKTFITRIGVLLICQPLLSSFYWMLCKLQLHGRGFYCIHPQSTSAFFYWSFLLSDASLFNLDAFSSPGLSSSQLIYGIIFNVCP